MMAQRNLQNVAVSVAKAQAYGVGISEFSA